jgi:hypothetical protein
MQESAEQRWTTVGVMQPYESLTRAVIPSPIRRAGAVSGLLTRLLAQIEPVLEAK